MARASLGSLVVSLGLDAAEFTAGLTKAEYDAKKMAAALDKGIATAARGAGIAFGAMATAGVAAFALIQQSAQRVASFKDLEEQTGASAEGLASMAVAAGTAETSMADVASASIKLTKNLVGVDDESKDAGAALAALGIPIKEFKQLDPAAQMEAVAKAMAGFEDGAAKTAVALALWGKAGAALLPFIKELGSESGRQVILTQQQIELADRYVDAQARARAQLQLYVQALAVEALPALTDVTKAAKEFILTLVGVEKASGDLAGAKATIASFADTVADKFASAIDLGRDFISVYVGIFKTAAAQSEIEKALITGNFAEAKRVAIAYLGDIAKILKPTTSFAAELAKTRAERQSTDAQRALEDRGFKPRGRELQFAGAAGKPGRDAAERQSDADRYLASLQKQLEHAQDLTVAEQALLDILKFKNVTAEQFAQIMNKAAEVDAAIAQKKAEQELAKAIEERTRAEQQTLDLYARETESIRAANDALAEEVMLIGADEKTRIEFAQAQLADTIARKENALAILQQTDLTGAQTAELQKQIELLKERQGILAQKAVKQQLLEDAAAAKKYNDIFVNSFTDGLASIVDGTKSVSDAFKDMERSIVQAITRIAAQKIAESIFGGATGGGGGIGGIFASLFGGAPAFATGTTYAPGGWAKVGERGPEMVHLPRGAQVIPNDVLTARRASVQQTVHVNVAGNVSSKTANQIGVEIGRATRRALARDA